MDNITLETLLVAQVLTLAASLKAEDKAKGISGAINYEREAVNLINRRSATVLELLARTPPI